MGSGETSRSSAAPSTGSKRVLQTQLKTGDRVAVEDPSWPRIAVLLHGLGLEPVPVRLDESGLEPEELERALRRDVRAVIATPRGTESHRRRQFSTVHGSWHFGTFFSATPTCS